MDTIRVLLITKDDGVRQIAERALSAGGAYRLYCVRDIGIAEARLEGGGIDLILADLASVGSDDEEQRLHHFVATRTIPSLVLCESPIGAGEPGSTGLAVYLTRARWEELVRQSRFLIHKKEDTSQQAPERPRRVVNSKVAFLGAKGGAGVTTIALNVAWQLAQTRDARLIELRSGFGTLRSHLRPQQRVASIANLARMDPEDITLEHVEAACWPCPSAPALRILCPPAEGECDELTPAHGDELLKALGRLCDHVLIDLPPYLSTTAQEALRQTDTLVLVMERDPISVDAARSMLRTITDRGWTPPSTVAVVVNRNPVVCPMAYSEIEKQLDMSLTAVIPPDPELCLTAQWARTAAIALNADSLMTLAFRELTHTLFGSAVMNHRTMGAELAAW